MSEAANTPEKFKDEYNFQRLLFPDAASLIGEGRLGDMAPIGSYIPKVGLQIGAPESLRFFCPGEDCLKEVSHRLVHEDGSGRASALDVPLKSGGAVVASYLCVRCGKAKNIMLVFYGLADEQARSYTFVKAGEWPPPGPPDPKVASQAGWGRRKSHAQRLPVRA